MLEPLDPERAMVTALLRSFKLFSGRLAGIVTGLVEGHRDLAFKGLSDVHTGERLKLIVRGLPA